MTEKKVGYLRKILPTISLTPSGDTSCDPTVFEGSIQMNITTSSGPGNDPLATYSYTWNPNGNPGQPTNTAGNTGNELISNLNEDTYVLTVANSLTGCTNTGSTIINPTTPPVFKMTASILSFSKLEIFTLGNITGLPIERNSGNFDGSLKSSNGSILPG